MELIILSELIRDEKYMRTVLPYLKPDYFDSNGDKIIFKVIHGFIQRYGKPPTTSAIATIVDRKRDINEGVFGEVAERLQEINEFSDKNDPDWLVDSTEEFCQTKAFENAILESAELLENGGSRYLAKDLVDDALRVSFNRSIGIEYFSDEGIRKRADYYKRKTVKFRTNIDKLNTITNGGLEEKALHVFLGDTHAGKTMTLASLAAGFVISGVDVLYITLEMSEEKIAALIDAHMLDIKINSLKDVPDDDFVDKFRTMDKSAYGRLFIKEYPTTTAGCATFRALLEELKYKKQFVPKVIVVDYINIAKCDRYTQENSYTLVKGTTEELRGLMVEGNYVGISATQTNRQGAQSSDLDMTDTAESYGLPQTVDLLIAMHTSDTLRDQNLLIWKSLKNRLAGIVGAKFPVKTSFEYARLLDADPEHENIVQNDTKNKVLLAKEKMKARLRSLQVNSNNSKEKQEADEKVFA